MEQSASQHGLHIQTWFNLSSFSSKPLPTPGPMVQSQACLRRRLDLCFQKSDGTRWNVLDPITRQSYRIGLIEHWLLTRPDGKTTVAQLLRKLRDEFVDLRLSDDQVCASLQTFLRNGLLWTAPRLKEDRESASGALQGWLGSTVVWQIRGIQPDRWLARIAPSCGVLFSLLAVKFWLLAALLTTLLVLFEFKRLSLQSLSLDWILHPATGGMLFFVFVVTRALHELGHALVCKRFGIRCPDIGMFVILGAPCVYCDVSESWQLPFRWQRAAVASAGMYVELVIATIAAWIWLATVDSWMNTLALQTMIVCSISTLLINANPLMRFDGYYILADWLDEVNLRSKADSIAATWIDGCLLGAVAARQSYRVPHQRLLLLFSLAGWVYRASLSLTIASILVAIYSGWNLQWFGRFLAAAILVSWWGVPVMKFFTRAVSNARKHGRRARLSIIATLIVLLVTIIPLPSRRLAVGWLQPLESQGVYATATSRLQALSAHDGQMVRAGEVLFQMDDQQLSIRLVGYQQAAEVAAIRLEANTRRLDMRAQEVDLRFSANQLEVAESWLENAKSEFDALSLRAPINGRLVAMAAAPATGAEEEHSPPHWCEAQQIGRVVAQGTLLASVCSDESIAVIPLTEEQLDCVASQTPVRIRLPERNQVVTDLTVESIIRVEDLSSPWHAAALASIPQSTTGNAEFRSSQFAAIVKLPKELRGLPGTTVDAVFVGKSRTIAQYLASWLRGNLRLLAD